MSLFKRTMSEGTTESEQASIATEKNNKKKIIAIITLIVVVCIAFVIVLTTIIIPNSKYNSAVELYNAGKYDEAITAFEAMNGYKDSAEQIIKCETAIKDQKYNAAVELYNAGKYDEAISAFESLNSYKDSAEHIENCYISKYREETYNLIKSIKVGDTYKFGSYEQNNKTSDGKEEIEWIVLEKNDTSLLLISKYALDRQLYNKSKANVTWETCSLREWLNGTFISNAFNSYEQNVIQATTVIADNNLLYDTPGGNNTTDKVFLLSIHEVYKYFSSDEARKCAPTEYAIAQGVWKSNSYTVGGKGACRWLLRSPGSSSLYAACVNHGGFVDDGGISVWGGDFGDVAIRPALWINPAD